MQDHIVDAFLMGDADRASYTVQINHKCNMTGQTGQEVILSAGLGPYRRTRTTVTCPHCNQKIVLCKDVSQKDQIYLETNKAALA